MKVGRLCSTQHISFCKIESNIKSVDMNTLYTKKEISTIIDTFETITPLSSTKYTYSKTYYPDTKTIIHTSDGHPLVGSPKIIVLPIITKINKNDIKFPFNPISEKIMSARKKD